MRPNRSPFAFMHSYAGSPARPVRAQKKPAWRGRGNVYRMIKRFRFLRMCAPAPHNLPYIPTQNKPLHHAPHPAVIPVPYSHRHRRAKFWRPDSKSFCRFCAAAVPRDRQTGSRGISRSAHLYKLHFVSFVVRSATLKKPRNGGNFRDRMWECRTAHAHSDIPHLVRAAPRHPRHRAKCTLKNHCALLANLRSLLP